MLGELTTTVLIYIWNLQELHLLAKNIITCKNINFIDLFQTLSTYLHFSGKTN